MEAQLEQLKKYIRSLVHISDESWNAAIPFIGCRQVARNDFFLHIGELRRDFGFVTSGLFRRFFVDSEGNEHNIYFASSGQLIGSYESLRSDRPSLTGVEAIEDTELLMMNFDNLKELADRYPVWREAILKATEQILDYRERREAQLLAYSAAERYRIFLDEFPSFAKRIPQYHIATYLGVTPEGLSRLIKKGKRGPTLS